MEGALPFSWASLFTSKEDGPALPGPLQEPLA